MKNVIVIIAAILIGFSASNAAEYKPKRPKSGYDYKTHYKKGAKYKKQNERGKKRKCNRK